MTGQCKICSGSGKCSMCSGRGELEASEPRTLRRTRHRFDIPGPQIWVVWRYRTLAVAKAPVELTTGGETLAKDDSMPTDPECAGETTWPCSAECWRPCSKCDKLVCEKHDYLVPVWPNVDGAHAPADMVCKECIAALWERGDISQGSRMQYLY
jgi:hypothetical protein